MDTYPIIAHGSGFSAFYLDELNGYLYAYSFRVFPGIGMYRISLDDINKGNTSLRYFTLIDSDIAMCEGPYPDEGVYVSQITGDGDYIYWSFNSADPSIPSGIKRIDAKAVKPKPEYVVKNIQAYGLVVKSKGGSGAVDNVVADKLENRYTQLGATILLHDDATIRIYNTSGHLLRNTSLKDGETLTLEELQNGLYILHLTFIDGKTNSLKIIK